MQAALALARRGLGNAWPNPAVGCLIVRNGRVLGRGWTRPGGRPHAETEALQQAGNGARGATAFVTLEPCSHHGQTPPCADALIAAGIVRVVFAVEDPNPKVDGRGAARLSAAGVDVQGGVIADAAAQLNAGFLSCIRLGRPLVSLKLATSLDGRIATRSGKSRWITGSQARQRGHMLRATHDAILIGRGTLTQDNPRLTCRLPGLEERSPVRVVLDSLGRIEADAAMLSDDGGPPVWVMTGAPERIDGLLPGGGEAIAVDLGADGRVDMTSALAALAARGITRVLVEGGAGVASSLLSSRLVDRLYWFRAPMLIGGDGLPAFAGLGVDEVADAIGLQAQGREQIGQDVLETFVRQS